LYSDDLDDRYDNDDDDDDAKVHYVELLYQRAGQRDHKGNHFFFTVNGNDYKTIN
jgi:hypothetical protein